MQSDKNQIGQEYKRAYYLNMFKKLCDKMNSDSAFKLSVLKLYRQSFDGTRTTEIIWQREYGETPARKDVEMLHSWIWAYFKKKPHRKPISVDVKQELYRLQNGKCGLCGDSLGNDFAAAHADHLIPWSLVGDELENNLQLVCGSCNKKKHSKTDYVFKNMIGLN